MDRAAALEAPDLGGGWAGVHQNLMASELASLALEALLLAC